jgi:hypothetical protein
MYDQILKRQVEVRTSSPSQSLMTLLDMAQWRRNYIQWGKDADQSIDKLHLPPAPAPKESAPTDKERAAS